ncbi:MAG TPA: PQQ-binding-like beta-propeller repeat protein [Candidatus Dormibacteraeota bacterium]|nr:PQQ-binding-like beta-propeller repeat protein [Candidatus Dormibacteraeota bacterium]
MIRSNGWKRLLAAAALLSLASAVAPATVRAQGSTPTEQDFMHASTDTSSWILPAHDYSGNRYAALTQITPKNVLELKRVWKYQLSDDAPTETAPIVWNGTIYVTSAHDHVYALDAQTGKLKWEYSDNPHVIAFAANRGIALTDGNVYIATLDGHLVALNAETGKKVWDKVEVADTSNSFFTMAPVPYKGMLLLGVSNGDWGGIGNISAFDPKDGHRIWQWNTVPGPGEPGHDTWSGDSWKRGGAAVWSGVAIDPATNTLYMSLGNPQPDFLGTVRKGANLYSNSMVALDISGAKPTLKWHYQFIPHDTHDWDPAMPPVLFTGKVNGHEEKLVAAADKAGNFWILDAATGRLVHKAVVSYQQGQGTEPDAAGNIACPNTNGGVEFNGGAFDPQTNVFYVPSVSECGLWKSPGRVTYIAGQFYLGGSFPKLVGPNTGDFNAINVSTGRFAWRYNFNLPAVGGALVTSTGLVFTGELNGDFDAFDAESGRLMWRYDTGSTIEAPPSAFMMGGKEYVVVASGQPGNQMVPELSKKNDGSMISVFALP